MDKNSIGERIKAAREKMNMTQAQLAESLGLSTRTIVRIENGEGGIGVERISEVAYLLNEKPSYFIDDTENTDKHSTRAAQDLDTLVKALASKNPDLVSHLRSASENIGVMSEGGKQTLADGLKYILALAELEMLPRLKQPKPNEK